MESQREEDGAHVLVLPYPSQGHINPMLQLSKRLASKGIRTTFATTAFIANSLAPKSAGPVRFATVSDGYDGGGFTQAPSIAAYLRRFQVEGSKSLADLVHKQASSDHPFTCIVYDAFMPWALEVARQLGLPGAAFFTQTCAVNYIYYQVHHRLLTLPVAAPPVSVPGLPLLDLPDMPSFIYVPGSYPAYFEMVLNQFVNADAADFVLVNTFYKLEEEVIDSMSKVCPLLTIGPTIPSVYLDNRVEDDNDYDVNLFNLDPSICIDWLSSKPKHSVVYVSFGSMAALGEDQIKELACALKATRFYFLWVVRQSEEAKLPKEFTEESREKGLIVSWSPQLKVLSSEAVGCFFTHCGWNSAVEALSLGVPMVGMPQWTDQPTNAKFVEDVWRVGVRVRVDENGLVGREEIENCVREVMEGERGREMKKNARKWRELAKEAVSEGGTSDKNIDEFISRLLSS